ncbi:hypothetical protein [Arenimonas aestuarii]
MNYPPEAIQHFETELPRVTTKLMRASIQAIGFAQQHLNQADAKKFMLHGVARRLNLIRRCAERIFEQFPPGQVAPLAREALEDVNICLHALVLHGNAIQDNLAWTYTSEFGLDFQRYDVSLFKGKLKKLLPQAIRDYLDKADVQAWHAIYSTDFRDGLAHRIPLYVPPAQLTEEDAGRAEELQRVFNESITSPDPRGAIEAQDELNSLGVACPYFLHELGDSRMILHPQALSDALTAAELSDTMIENWAPPEYAA